MAGGWWSDRLFACLSSLSALESRVSVRHGLGVALEVADLAWLGC